MTTKQKTKLNSWAQRNFNEIEIAMYVAARGEEIPQKYKYESLYDLSCVLELASLILADDLESAVYYLQTVENRSLVPVWVWNLLSNLKY